MGRCEQTSQVKPGEGRQRIAIIGSGIAGQSAAYFLKKKHDVVAVYEAAPKPGLHTHSIQVEGLGAVDVPLRAFSPHYYPNLTKLYKHLGVVSQSVNYSSTGTHYNNGKSYFQYYNLQLLRRAIPFVWGQQLNLLSWLCTFRIVCDLLWFVACGTYFLHQTKKQRQEEQCPTKKHCVGTITLGSFLRQWNFSYEFVHYFLYPVMSTLLSCSYAQVDAYPAEFILEFYSSRSTTIFTGWNKVPDGVETVSIKLLASLGEDVLRLSTKVKSLRTISVPTPEGGSKKQVQVTTTTGQVDLYDHVVIATESNIAKALWDEGVVEGGDSCLGDMSELLGKMDHFTADLVVHNDLSLMPATKDRWSGMNYFSFPSASIDCGKIDRCNGGANAPPGAELVKNHNASMTSVWVNRYVKLSDGAKARSINSSQNGVTKRRSGRTGTPPPRGGSSIPLTTSNGTTGAKESEEKECGDVFQTWNPYHLPDPATVVSRATMTRAVWTVEGKAAYERVFTKNQGTQHVWLCGSYASPGVTLLENAVASALDLALDFGVSEADLPFKPEPCYQSSWIALLVGYIVFHWRRVALLLAAVVIYFCSVALGAIRPVFGSF